MPEAIMEVAQVPLGVVMLQEELASFEWLVVDDRQGVCVVQGGLNETLPDLLVCIFSEKHVVHSVEQGWMVQFVSTLLEALVKRSVELWVANVPHTVRVGQMCEVTVVNLVQAVDDNFFEVEVGLLCTAHFVVLTS